MKKVKIGFIGCGFMGQCVHLPSFMRVKGAEVVALSDLRFGLAKAVAKRWGIPRVYRSHIELIEDEDIDAVVEITNKFVHAEIAIDSLKAGKHVFTEKPMATCSRDAEEMVRLAERENLKLMVGYMKRYDPGVLKAKEAFDDFIKHDKVTYARSHIFMGDWICGPTAEPMIETDEKYPEIEPRFPEFLPRELRDLMNTLLEQVHDINLPRYFLGDPVAVESVKRWPWGSIVILDYGDHPLILEVGSLSADFWDEELLIHFRDGWIDVRPPPPLLRNVPAKVHIYKAGKVQRDEYPHGAHSWSFERQAQHFVDCIIEDREPISNGADSYKDIAIIESIMKTAIKGTRTKIKI
ncbi:hypothetical protein DRO55_05960 [Candidatus Bathyarchaeota archaeon]|nr:MAG: hypothetical protein DRO55_05960 [Candidatus Bathyarchaeota archaeon]